MKLMSLKIKRKSGRLVTYEHQLLTDRSEQREVEGV
jgi:hypothetical protein